MKNRRRHDLRDIAHRVMKERGLEPDFSAAVERETEALTRAAPPEGQGIRDLRGRLWASIDNDDSRDLDQLSDAEPAGGGSARVFVAIADVDALVVKGSAIDDHARQNTTSVYTAAEIFPMLPLKLSTDLTSLVQDQDRRAVVIEMVIGADGEIGETSIYPAAVRNRAKLAYNSVAAWLEGTGPARAPLAAVAGLDARLRLQDQVAQTLKSVRHRHGALGLETIEARAVFENDLLMDLRPEEKNRAKSLIEELMVAANGVTARFLASKGFPSMRRVLRSPERWDRIVELAAKTGDRLPADPDSGELDRFLQRRKQADPDRFPDLSLSVVKLMGSGEYAVESPGGDAPGHFGLAVRDYTHSTAPNRRYPDVITQRLLKAAIGGGRNPYDVRELNGLAIHCTEQEDNAQKVERQVGKSAAALILENRIGQQFDGIVTGASEKGTWVRIFSPPAEGMVVRGAEGLDVGDRVKVKLVETNVERGFIDFAR